MKEKQEEEWMKWLARVLGVEGVRGKACMGVLMEEVEARCLQND